MTTGNSDAPAGEEWIFDFGFRVVVEPEPDMPIVTRSGRPLTVQVSDHRCEPTRPDIDRLPPGFIEITVKDPSGRQVGRATAERSEDTDVMFVHGVIDADYRRDGLARLFFSISSERAAAEGRTLSSPTTMTSDGARAWRGRNYLSGATMPVPEEVVVGPRR